MLPDLSMELPRLPFLSNFTLSFSSFSSALAASLLAFWEAFSSCFWAFRADLSCRAHKAFKDIPSNTTAPDLSAYGLSCREALAASFSASLAGPDIHTRK